MTQSPRTTGLRSFPLRATSPRRRHAPLAVGLGLGLFLSGCSGSGSSAGTVGSSGGAFELSQVSVSNGGTWQVNRPIKFTFSFAVDFDTVNLNTIQIQQQNNGAPAVGEFSAVAGEPRSIMFQPVCPRRQDFSDAGFRPGGIVYQVNVPTEDSGASTVRSTQGRPVTSGYTMTFKTPTSSLLAQLFLDPVPGPAQPEIVKPNVEPAFPTTSIVVRDIDEDDDGNAEETELFFHDVSGEGVLLDSYEVKNNFYSDDTSRVSLRVRFNQPVSPLAENINSERLSLQYQEGSSWVTVSSEVFLESNCVGTGASVRLTPIGILPQGRRMRVVVSPEFEDLVGERNPSPLDRFALMDTAAVLDGGAPAEMGDEVLDEYMTTVFEDDSASLPNPAADWGDGELKAAFAFDGTGGPSGQFDLRIPANSDVVFDTTSTLFFGGPNFEPQFTQLAVNGRLDVRNLEIPAGSTLRIQGPKPAIIYATGYVKIDGRIAADGSSANPVFSLNTPYQPESGGAGQGGGGDGGTGSYLTNAVTLRGGNGEGPGGAANAGGQGGESGWSTVNSGNGVQRRAAGGGGGVFGPDQMYEVNDGGNTVLCADQEIYGLDAENGFPGHQLATSSQGGHIPYGGLSGPGPFGVLPGTENDFFGTKIMGLGTPEETLVKGELTKALGGAGGGAGGDATHSPDGVYPPQELINNHQDKGAGGGGGAGAITILALGDIEVSNTGSITAIGGFGTGGENTAGTNRVGGGSGGGSGGHIILQTASRIDLSAASSSLKALNARGGQGGEGAGGAGGANDQEQNNINNDAKHTGENNNANPDCGFCGPDNGFEIVPLPCVLDFDAGTQDVVRAAGGDGGPGLIQLHVGDLGSDILYPGNEASLANIVWPPPHGYDGIEREWKDHLLPIFGRYSMSQSKWIELGEASVDPDTDVPDPIAFLFDGTDSSGFVEATAGVIDPLPALLTEGAPTIDPEDSRVLLMDASPLSGGADAIYLRNPNLLRNFHVAIGGDSFYVEQASYDSDADQLELTVTEESLVGATGMVSLHPRYFGITTQGTQGSLPASSSVLIEFDLMGVHPDDPSDTSTTDFVPNLAGEDLNALGIDPDHIVRFMRYRVTFDITQGTFPLDAQTPLPSIEFLRLPFTF